MRFPLAWGVLILGNSVLEGFGSALLIPPVYILTTLLFTDLTSRARAFGRISGMGGIGAATGPLFGELITTAISWRAAFLFWFFLHIRARERAGKEPLVSTSLFRSRTSNLGLVTQNVQWLLLIGPGLGVMLTPSVNVVQSAFPGDQQGEISGLSRSVSTLGSSLGTAIAGTILVSDLASGNRSYALAMASLAVIGLIGQVAAIWLPPTPCRSRLDGRRAQGTVDGPATVLASSARVSGRRPCRRSRRTLMPGRPRCGGTAWTR